MSLICALGPQLLCRPLLCAAFGMELSFIPSEAKDRMAKDKLALDVRIKHGAAVQVVCKWFA